jgi:hypothetical protein
VPAKYKIQINQRYTNPGRQVAPPVRIIFVSPQYGIAACHPAGQRKVAVSHRFLANVCTPELILCKSLVLIRYKDH